MKLILFSHLQAGKAAAIATAGSTIAADSFK
jgi:hypothetical protein